MKLIDLSRHAKFRVSGMKRLSQNIKRPLYSSVLCFFLLSIMEMNCAAQDIKNLALPGDFECLVDKANLIDSEHKKKIRDRGKRLLKNTKTPIFVVTINKMSDHVDEEMSIKTFADLLFKQWRIGSPWTGENLSKGILLLVSKEDNQLVLPPVNIHLGAGWGQEKDNHKDWVMTDVILPRFKRGMFSRERRMFSREREMFSRGIFAGFDALQRMVPNGMDLIEIDNSHDYVPGIPRTRESFSPPFILAIVLGLWTLISVWFRGSEGMAWKFWARLAAPFIKIFGK